MNGFKGYFISLMRGERNSIPDKAVAAMLSFLSFLYALGVKVTVFLYRSGLRKVFCSRIPVISVGNLTLGATGKTPFSLFVAEYALSSGKKPAILIRGYGNDEHRMLAEESPDVRVLTGQNRKKNLAVAEKEGIDIAVLDDGFQHRAVARDLDILLIDAVSVFGNEKIFPRGTLREPLSALKRADMFVLTKTDSPGSDAVKEVIARLRKSYPDKPVILSEHKTTFLGDMAGNSFAPEYLKDKRTLLVSGIGDPGYFTFLVSKCGAVISSKMDFIDHYGYEQADITGIHNMFRQSSSEVIVTTKKDLVKMRDLDLSIIEQYLYVLNITINISYGREALFAGLDSVISGAGN